MQGGKQRERRCRFYDFSGSKGVKENERRKKRATPIVEVESKVERWNRRSGCEFHSISRPLTIERARSSVYAGYILERFSRRVSAECGKQRER